MHFSAWAHFPRARSSGGGTGLLSFFVVSHHAPGRSANFHFPSCPVPKPHNHWTSAPGTPRTVDPPGSARPILTPTMCSSASRLLHPASGLAILALDWLLFSGNVASLGLSTVAVSVLGAVLGTVGTAFIQRRYGRDGPFISLLKGLAGGVVIGLPLPIAGTAAGGAILTLSGLRRWSPRSSNEPPSPDNTNELDARHRTRENGS